MLQMLRAVLAQQALCNQWERITQPYRLQGRAHWPSPLGECSESQNLCQHLCLLKL